MFEVYAKESIDAGVTDPGHLALDVMEKNKKWQNANLYPRKKDRRPRGQAVAQRMVNKLLEPEFKDPPLLTWLEQQTIKHLHKQDPVEYSVMRLSEGETNKKALFKPQDLLLILYFVCK